MGDTNNKEPSVEIARQVREMRALHEKRRETSAAEYVARTRAFATDLEGNGWPADLIEFMRSAADAVEMIALERKFDAPVMH
jgi:hypothetical protein